MICSSARMNLILLELRITSKPYSGIDNFVIAYRVQYSGALKLLLNVSLFPLYQRGSILKKSRKFEIQEKAFIPGKIESRIARTALRQTNHSKFLTSD